MAAQFFSSLADNALFVLAVELLRVNGAPEWQRAALVPMFALFYVVLAPFVGAFADALPKGRVMFLSNAIKVVGCLMLLTGVQPLLAYAIVGLGAAAYSPAKYGILTELLPPSQLVKANGWIEGLTIGSIILGVLLGGLLLHKEIGFWMLEFANGFIAFFPLVFGSLIIQDSVLVAVFSMMGVYALAAAFNTLIPRTNTPLINLPKRVSMLLKDFGSCNRALWRDRLGQITLASTTLFWGVSGNLRYIVLAWAAAALSYDTSQASSLVGVVAIGTAVGALVASARIKLQEAVRVIPLGVLMGFLVIVMVVIDSVWVAAPFLILLGALGGFLVVPMNALLQHRGHNLMGAGRSIAVQNFNEQACILFLGALYALSTALGMSAFWAIAIFGLIVALTMLFIQMWHKHNLRHHRLEVDKLLLLASQDEHHSS
jgi:MFS family permease